MYAKYNYGLYYNNELVSLMAFGIPRLNMGGDKSEGNYEKVMMKIRQSTR